MMNVPTECFEEILKYTDLFLYDVKGLYVNSWGRDKKEIIASRVGVKASARFLCTAEEDSVSEITEVTHPKTDPF